LPTIAANSTGEALCARMVLGIQQSKTLNARTREPIGRSGDRAQWGCDS
jgi:hypothetical protein